MKKIAIFTHNNKGRYPGSSYINIILPLFHKSIKNKILPTIITKDVLGKVDILEFIKNNSFDSILVHRDVLDILIAKRIINLCKSQNIKLIYAIDDDLLSICKSHPEYHKYKAKNAAVKLLSENADVVVVTTPNLAKRFTNCKKVKIILASLDENLWLSPVKKIEKACNDKRIDIGYMGTFTHDQDLMLIKNIIISLKKRLLKTKGICLNFYLLGITKKTEDWFIRIPIPNGKDDYPHFVKWIRENINWDIAIAPLQENNFNKCKAEQKYLDYTGLGIPGIYSNVEPYSRVINDKKNGILVENNIQKEWEDKLFELIMNKKLRENILIKATEDFKANYLLKDRVQKWLEIFEDYE